MILYRPVGTKELELIKQSEYTKYPARLPEQSIFYPVLNAKYNDDHKGYVTKFEIDDEYFQHFDIHTVGASYQQEIWVLAQAMEKMHQHMIGKIQVICEIYVNNGVSIF